MWYHTPCPCGYSSAGRALEWHSRGQRFDPAYLHQQKPTCFYTSVFCRLGCVGSCSPHPSRVACHLPRWGRLRFFAKTLRRGTPQGDTAVSAQNDSNIVYWFDGGRTRRCAPTTGRFTFVGNGFIHSEKPYYGDFLLEMATVLLIRHALRATFPAGEG